MLAGMLPSSGLAVLQAAPQVFVTGVIPYPYRQDADFQYFTGITQPGAVAVLQSNGRYILFYPDYNETEVKWNGARLSHDATLSFFGADEAYPMREMPSRLSTMLAAASTIVLEPESPNLAPLAATVSQLPGTVLAAQQGRVQPLRPLTHKLRWRKTPAELALMRRSAAAAASAMTQCMAHTRPGVSEHTIASLFEWRCKAAGAQRMAYPPVVAGGPDACTIHYSRNDKMLTAQDLLLLDGGCEMWGYASDVTRTWPVGGKFSSPQTAIYEAVLSAHRQLIEACRPGVTLRQLHHLSVRLLTDSLYGLGIAKGPNADAIVANGTFRKYYLHSVGHWLGMDTHDSSTMVHDRPLEPGVVLTIEPGELQRADIPLASWFCLLLPATPVCQRDWGVKIKLPILKSSCYLCHFIFRSLYPRRGGVWVHEGHRGAAGRRCGSDSRGQ